MCGLDTLIKVKLANKKKKADKSLEISAFLGILSNQALNIYLPNLLIDLNIEETIHV